MRNFGATAPPLAPEPRGEETLEGSNGAGKEGGGIATKQSSEWPAEGSSSLDERASEFPAKNETAGEQSLADVGNESSVDLMEGTQRLAKELDDFVANGMTAASTDNQGEKELPSDDAIADLQLQTARKLRQLLPTNRELLHLVQEKEWIPLLLGWLNLHDRPAVQVEALLALTNIAELCAHHSYYQHAQSQSSAAVAAAAAQAAAAAAVKAGGTNLPATAASSIPPFYSYPSPSTAGDNGSGTQSSLSGSYPYNSLLAPTQGQIPFPPLSFSQQMKPEDLAAFDATLSNTIQQTKAVSGSPSTPAGSVGNASTPSKTGQTKGSSSSSQMTPLPPYSSLTAPYPPVSLSPPENLSTLLSSASSMSAASSGSPFLPPPTPVPNFGGGGGGNSFPQQLSASSQHLLLRHADAIPTLISLLSSPNRDVYEQAMWILGSIAAGDSPGGSTAHGSGSSSGGSGDGGREKSVAARDVILAAGIMNQLLRCLEAHTQNLSLQRIGSWTLSNLVEGLFQQSSHGKSGSRSNDYSSSDEIDPETLIPVLRRLLLMGDAEVLSYTCWTLSHLCDGPSSHISVVVTTRDGKGARGGLVPRLVELLIHPSWRVTKPALRTIGNIVCAECSEDNNHGSSSSSGPTDYTEVILDCGAVPRLKELVTHSNREIQKEACWTLSNIAAGTVDQIQAVIDSGAIPPLVSLVGDKTTDTEVRSEACWVVLNATSCGSDSQIEVLVDEGCVSVLGVLLDEPSMVMMALEGLERVLQVEETREAVRREQLESGEEGKDGENNNSPSLVSASLIEKALDKHNSSAVTKRASRIWKQHFVNCALCNKSFSKHRTCDATFCEECKCYVCSNCDCRMYHLSYQEELWADEEVEAKKSAKKSKKQKKKKQKKAKQQVQPQPSTPTTDTQQETPSKDANATSSRTSPVSSEETQTSLKHKKQVTPDKIESKVEASGSVSTSSGSSESEEKKGGNSDNKDGDPQSNAPYSDKKQEVDVSGNRAAMDDGNNSQQPQQPIDFVMYLQETGSIIALAKLMDAMDHSDGSDFNMDEELDDTSDAQLIGRRQVLNQQATP